MNRRGKFTKGPRLRGWGAEVPAWWRDPKQANEGGMRAEVAIHETGHAIVSLALGEPVWWLSVEGVVVDGKAVAGGCRYESARCATHKRILRSLGAVHAEALYYQLTPVRGSSEEIRDAEEWVARAYGGTVWASPDRWHKTTRCLLSLYWPSVLEVASALRARGRMTGGAIAMLLADSRLPAIRDFSEYAALLLAGDAPFRFDAIGAGKRERVR